MEKSIVLLIFFLFTSSNIYAHGMSNKNFIYSIASQKAMQPWNCNFPNKKVIFIQSVNYHYGLGCPMQLIIMNHSSNKITFNLQHWKSIRIFVSNFIPVFCKKGDMVVNLYKNETGSFEEDSVLWQFVKNNLLSENQYNYKK
jgi:hypothetical protein